MFYGGSKTMCYSGVAGYVQLKARDRSLLLFKIIQWEVTYRLSVNLINRKIFLPWNTSSLGQI